MTCGSVWACPVDSAKIAARRSLEIGCGLLTWENDGGALVMGTLTMRHHRGMRCSDEWDALLSAWGSVNGSKGWRTWLQRLGSPGLVRVVEVTFSYDNGWHVHLHFVLLVAPADDLPGEVDDFRAWLYPTWQRALDRRGASSLDGGQDLHLVSGVRAANDLGQYLAKSTAYGAAEALGRELMGSATKRARGLHSTSPVWSIAETFAGSGDLDLLDLWHEYETASKGRRQIGWSRGLRARLALGVEATDEQIADEDVGDEDLLYITADGWKSLCRRGSLAVSVLEVMERDGLAGVRSVLESEGIEYREVDQ